MGADLERDYADILVRMSGEVGEIKGTVLALVDSQERHRKETAESQQKMKEEVLAAISGQGERIDVLEKKQETQETDKRLRKATIAAYVVGAGTTGGVAGSAISQTGIGKAIAALVGLFQ